MENSQKSTPIKISFVNGIPMIWNPEDVYHVQTKCRIIGRLIGPAPKSGNQSGQKGLPLELTKVEATLLFDKGFAIPVAYPALLEKPDETQKKLHEDLAEKFYEEQVESAAQARETEIINISDQILKGKLKKLKKQGIDGEKDLNLTKEKVIQDEVAKIKPLPRAKSYVRTYVEHPSLDTFEPSPAPWMFPESEFEKLKYAIFKDLWEKKFYITGGLKFGGDYLAYPHDPCVCHANYIVKCLFEEEFLSPCDIVSWIRVGTATKKALVLASVEKDGKVSYLTLNWAGDDLSALPNYKEVNYKQDGSMVQ